MDQPVTSYSPEVTQKVSDISVPETSLPDGKINLNTATKEQLKSLPGIGDKMSDYIIQYRREKPFKQIRDLKKINGIGDKTFQKLAELVCVTDEERNLN